MSAFTWIHSKLGYICILFMLFHIFFSGCSNKRINNLQGSVDTLENQLQQFQQTAQQETEFTTTSLAELQKEISQAFRDIRYSQTNMESLIEQISNRLAAVERQITQMQTQIEHLEAQALDNFNAVNVTIQQSRDEANQKLNQHIENMRAVTASIRDESASLKQQDQSLQSNLNRLQSQIETMDQENRKVFDRILKDLGVEAPKPEQQTGNPEPSSSGKTYTVQPGDSLSKIASKHNVSMADLQRANTISDPSKIFVGQVLQIP